jgi:predicted O-linked N-acetylglucosamine transferase (SPINDLY family)
VFCGFCQSVKLSGAVFDVWMRILTRVPDSVLWLLEHNALVPQSLRAEAERRGIDPSRLIFAPRVGERDHMTRHTHADLLLDTWPCGAHTSASDALWVGVPVVTSPGRTFASRVAASILHAIGLKELIVDGLQAYEDLAVFLAQSPTEFQRLQHTLEQNRASHPLFDTARSCRALERAYAQMWSVHAAGLPPASFNIAGSHPDLRS